MTTIRPTYPPPANRVICFYHTDLDGICSAAIVNHVHQISVECRPINYGHPFPWDEITKDITVIMVDFSLRPYSDMVQLAKQAKHLTWIDHHKTSISGDDGSIDGLRRVGDAGCELTWEYFMGAGGRRPWVVTALGRWDVWDHHDPRFNDFQFGMRAYNPTPDDNIWKRLFDDSVFTNDKIQSIIHNGRAIVNYTQIAFEEMVHAYGFVTKFEGLKFLACNCAFRGGSKIFESVWDESKYDAMLLYRWSPRAGAYTCSVYSDKEGIDVGAIAKKHGGGGHTGAAGFQCKELPFPVSEIPVE